MKKIILKILYILGFHRMARYFNRGRIIILMYHGFTDKDGFIGIANYHYQNLHIKKFRAHLGYIKKNYNVISLGDFVGCIKSGKKIPFYSVILTIDDGYRSNYIYAFPLLKEYALPATIFVTTSFVDNKIPLWADRMEYSLNHTKNALLEMKNESLFFNITSREMKIACDKQLKAILKKIPQQKRERIIVGIENNCGVKLSIDDNTDEVYKPLNWNEISEMLESGLVSIGSHAHSHYILSKCAAETIGHELGLSKRIIEEKTGKECSLFCYPNGKPDDFNDNVIELLKKNGFDCALTTITGMNEPVENPFKLKRIGVGDEADMIEFVMKVSGVMRLLQDVKKLLGR